MKEKNLVRRRSWLWVLTCVVALPIVLGVLGGYGLHRYQASQIKEEFSPYRPATVEMSKPQQVAYAYVYIQKPLEIEFGEVDNYKRYREDWEAVNSGHKPLEIELVSQTCDVEFDGKPIRAKESIPGRKVAKISLSWVVQNSDKDFRHELVLKTNDNAPDRRNLRFQVQGTVNPGFDLLPPVLDFGTLTGGQTKELSARVVCYRTKTFKIEDISFSNEAHRAGFDVRFAPIDDLSSLGGDRIPAAAYSVVVTAKADQLEKKDYSESLLLRCNLPQTEGLQLGLKVSSQ